MMPTRRIAFAGHNGKFFKGEDQGPAVTDCLENVQVGLPLEIAHEETEDVSEIENHYDKEGDGAPERYGGAEVIIGEADQLIKWQSGTGAVQSL